MAPIRNSRLFPHSEKSRQEREVFRGIQDRVRQMTYALAAPHSKTASQVQRQARELAADVRRISQRLPNAAQLIRLAESAERQAAEQEGSLTMQLLNRLGQPGSVIQQWLRGREGALSFLPVKRALEEAGKLLAQHESVFADQAAATTPGREQVRPRPESFPSSRTNSQPALDSRYADSSMVDQLHPNVSVLPNGSVQIVGPGFRRTYRATDPEITGEAVPVSSSNVYSIQLQLNLSAPTKSELIIRFKGKSGGGGASYAYTCHPDYFTEMLEANSKGRFVWDQLRIRGTVAGHQVPYRLIRAEIRNGSGYLPRKAVVVGGIQKLVQRSRTAFYRNGRTERLTSTLPDRVLGRYSPPRGSAANVGNRDRSVDRGIPNRGTPDRGAPPRGPFR